MTTMFTLINLFSLYQVIWTNTIIDIPLGDSTYEYYDLPDVELYLDSKLLINEEYYIEKGVNRTSLSVVNSKNVREFKIDYRVTFYEVGIISEQTITFNIIDITPPEVMKVPTFRYPINTKIPSDKILLEDLHFKDNYYENKEIIVKINGLFDININKIGVYEIEFEIMDPSYNTTIITTTYEVFDNEYPKIEYKDPIVHNIDKQFNYYEYFKFAGNNLRIEVIDELIDYKNIGTYPIIIRASNESGLTTTITTTILIVDKSPPVISVKTNIEPLEVNTNLNDQMLLNYILKIEDNYDILTKEDVQITTDLNINKIGKYIIIYELEDSSKNKTSLKININVVDSTKPNVTILEELIFNVLTEKPYWLNYFDITDNYDDFSDLNISFKDNNIKFDRLGTYYLEVSVIDSSKNKTTKDIPVQIKDLEPPVIEQIKDIYVYDFFELSKSIIKEHFYIKDNYDEYVDISMNIIEDNTSYDKIGIYKITLIFFDKSQNYKTIDTHIKVVDIEKPVIKLKNEYVYYFIDDKIPDFTKEILSIEDNYDNPLIGDVLIEYDINCFNKIGKYNIDYILEDSSGNEAFESITLIVDKRITSLISGKDIIININESWNQLDGIILHEDVINYDVIYDYFSTNEECQIEVLYIAYDKRGNTEHYSQTIYVKNDRNNLLKSYIKFILATVIYIVSIITIYYKSKKGSEYNF